MFRWIFIWRRKPKPEATKRGAEPELIVPEAKRIEMNSRLEATGSLAVSRPTAPRALEPPAPEEKPEPRPVLVLPVGGSKPAPMLLPAHEQEQEQQDDSSTSRSAYFRHGAYAAPHPGDPWLKAPAQILDAQRTKKK